MRSGVVDSGKVPRTLTGNPEDQQELPVISGMQKSVALPEPWAGLDCWPLHWTTPCCLGIINLPFCAANLLQEWGKTVYPDLLSWLTWRLSEMAQTGPNGKFGTWNPQCSLGWTFYHYGTTQGEENCLDNWDVELHKSLKPLSTPSKLWFGVNRN